MTATNSSARHESRPRASSRDGFGDARSERRSVFRQSLTSNPPLLVAAAGALVLHVLADTTPPGWALLGFAPLTAVQWVIALGLGVTVLALVEADKAISRRASRLRIPPPLFGG